MLIIHRWQSSMALNLRSWRLVFWNDRLEILNHTKHSNLLSGSHKGFDYFSELLVLLKLRATFASKTDNKVEYLRILKKLLTILLTNPSTHQKLIIDDLSRYLKPIHVGTFTICWVISPHRSRYNWGGKYSNIEYIYIKIH